MVRKIVSWHHSTASVVGLDEQKINLLRSKFEHLDRNVKIYCVGHERTGIWLPGLPPFRNEITNNSRMRCSSVKCYSELEKKKLKIILCEPWHPVLNRLKFLLTPMQRNSEQWYNHRKLYPAYFNRMYGGNRERSWLLIPMVNVMEPRVKKWPM